MKPKKKSYIKCKRKECKALLNISEVNSYYKNHITESALKDVKGYCSITCLSVDKRDKEEKQRKVLKDERELKSKIINKWWLISKSIKEMIHNGEMTEKVLDKINQEIEKAKICSKNDK